MEERSLDVGELVVACRRGVAGARAQLAAALVAPLRSAAWAVLGDRHEAEDVAQDWLSEHLEALVQVEPPHGAAAYARRSVRNRAVDVMRRRRRERPLAQGFEIEDERPSAEAALGHHEACVRLRAAVASLREPDRSILLGFYEGRLSYDQLAQQFSTSSSSIKRILGACRLRLARRVLGEGADDGR